MRCSYSYTLNKNVFSLHLNMSSDCDQYFFKKLSFNSTAQVKEAAKSSVSTDSSGNVNAAVGGVSSEHQCCHQHHHNVQHRQQLVQQRLLQLQQQLQEVAGHTAVDSLQQVRHTPIT